MDTRHQLITDMLHNRVRLSLNRGLLGHHKQVAVDLLYDLLYHIPYDVNKLMPHYEPHEVCVTTSPNPAITAVSDMARYVNFSPSGMPSIQVLFNITAVMAHSTISLYHDSVRCPLLLMPQTINDIIW